MMAITTTTMLAARRPLTRCLISRSNPVSTSQARGVGSSSSAGGSQSSKICAVPFGLRPEDAMTRLHMTGLLASGQLSNIIYAGLLRLFGPGISSYAQEFGLGESVTMKGMKAVLYPIWRIDAIFEGGVEAEKTRKEKEAFLAVEEGYIPGNPFAPLSYLSFSVPPLEDHLETYRPETDLKQLGEGFDIVPVPFTVSPIGLIERIRSEVGRRTAWQGIRFNETQWKEKLLAMYPVMFPIYIAEFEHKTEARTWNYQVVMDAHDGRAANCRISWPPPPELVQAGRFDTNYYMNPAPFLPTTHFLTPRSMTPKDGVPLTGEQISERFSTWMSPPPPSPKAITPSPISGTEREGGIEWDDVRVQSWSGTERHDNGEFIEKSVELNKAIKSMQDFAEFSDRLGPDKREATGTIITLGSGTGRPRVQQKSVEDMRADMEKDVKRLRALLQDIKPVWLKEWEKAKDSARNAGKSE